MVTISLKNTTQNRLGGVSRARIPHRVRPVLLAVLFLFMISGVQAQANDKWSLHEMIDYAMANNITIQQNELDLETASNNYTQSTGLRLPSVSMYGSQSLTRGTSTDPITYDFVTQNINSTSLGITAEMTIYNGGEINNTIKQSKLIVDQNSLFLEEAKNNIALSLNQGYMEALYYYEGVEIARKNLESSRTQLQRSEALHEAGSIAAMDLAEIKSQFASDQYNLVAAQNSFDQQVLTLKQLLELTPETVFDIQVPESLEAPLLIPEKYDVYQSAIENRPEIRSALLQQDISELDLSIAKSGYKPTLSLTGSMGTGYTNTQVISFSEQFDNNFNQRLGLTLRIPIFSQFQTKTSIQNAKIGMQSAQLDLSATKKTLYANIENAHQSVVAATSEMEAAKEQVNATQLTFDLASHQYLLGLISSTDLLIAQNNLFAAQQTLIQAKYRAILYYSLLQFYAGEQIEIIKD